MARDRKPGRGAGQASRARRLLLWCAATDSSFERADVAGETVLTGKCIHCGARHVIALDGRPRTRASVEHIVPRTHGGTDDLANLAIACERCNFAKGVRLDPRRLDDPTLQRVVATLQARRAARMREPPAWLELPPLPPST
ncbi:MAG: HNH endonuclease [Myxococcales bacterium]|nr:HNH endonuclease [Myxococcales bacterium]